ncbi:MAG: glutathione synthase [Polyangiaceae bacterium]|nr:glutathione synthase [Polyangiaceae bacterium]
MRFLFVMDPAEGMLPDRDTSFAFMRGSQARGHACLHCLIRDVFHFGREVSAWARPIEVRQAPPHVRLGAPATVELGSVDAVFVRKDPPFDTAYLHLTQQLDLVSDRTFVMNDPRGLRDANEKLFAFHFAELMPRSLVSADGAQLLEFVRSVGGKAVLKPLDGAGGRGVVALTLGDPNTRALVDLLTREGTEPALAQEYLPEIREGDKRVLLLDGQPLGAILRVPRADDLRANIHVGGQVRHTTLTPAELKLVGQVAGRLRSSGLWFVGLDLIAGRLIEVNVTSPTGIQELGRHLGTSPEQEVIAWVEGRVALKRAGREDR